MACAPDPEGNAAKHGLRADRLSYEAEKVPRSRRRPPPSGSKGAPLQEGGLALTPVQGHTGPKSGEMETTVEIKAVSVGTELNITQTGIPDMIPVEMCYLGWQESLVLLTKLVEAEIPD